MPDLSEEIEKMVDFDCKAEIQSQESPTQYVMDKIIARQWV